MFRWCRLHHPSVHPFRGSIPLARISPRFCERGVRPPNCRGGGKSCAGRGGTDDGLYRVVGTVARRDRTTAAAAAAILRLPLPALRLRFRSSRRGRPPPSWPAMMVRCPQTSFLVLTRPDACLPRILGFLFFSRSFFFFFFHMATKFSRDGRLSEPNSVYVFNYRTYSSSLEFQGAECAEIRANGEYE